MLTYITKALTIAALISAPILAGLAVARSQIAGSFRRMQEFRDTQCKNIEYMDSKPHDYMKPEVVIMENKRVLKLNTPDRQTETKTS